MDKINSYNNKLPRHCRARLQRGASTVEFILLAPFLLWLTFAIVQYSFALNMINAVTQLARDGGRYAAVHGEEATSDSNGTTANSIRWYVEKECAGTSLGSGTITDSMISIGTLDTSKNPPQFVANTYTNRQTMSGQIVTVQIKFPIGNHLQMQQFVPGLSQLASVTRQGSFILENPNAS